MPKTDLCDYSDAYIDMKGKTDLLVAAANENDKTEKDVAFKKMHHLGRANQKLATHR